MFPAYELRGHPRVLQQQLSNGTLGQGNTSANNSTRFKTRSDGHLIGIIFNVLHYTFFWYEDNTPMRSYALIRIRALLACSLDSE